MAEPSQSASLGRNTALAFVAPALGLIGVFLIFPALWTLYLGLTDLRLTGLSAADPQFVGLRNFTNAISDGQFLNSVKVTFLFVIGSLIGQVGLGFTLAWMFRSWTGLGRRLLEVLVILAWIIPGSVVAFLWIAFLDGDSGTLNALLGPLDAGTEWLLRYPLLSIIIFNTWRGTAFAMLLFGAALGAIPPSHLEAARLAGAQTWQQLRDVVLPTIRGHVFTAFLLITLWTFNLFTPYLLTRSGPNFRTDILPAFVFREAISSGRLGYGAAISVVMLLINLLLAGFYLRIVRERKV
ncbi:MAG: carbohydrate ABC transporter permease [Actinomycetota bacterium]